MNVEEEKQEKKKPNKNAWEVVKRVLAIIGVLLLGVLFVFSAFLNDDKDEATVAHAETLEQIQAETKYYLKIPAGTVFYITVTYNGTFSGASGTLLFEEAETGDWNSFSIVVCCYIDLYPVSENMDSNYFLYGHYDSSSRTYVILNDSYFCISKKTYDSFSMYDEFEFYLTGHDFRGDRCNFYGDINLSFISLDYSANEDLENAYNQGVDGLITTDYGFDTLYIRDVSTVLLDSLLSQLTYSFTDNIYYVYYQDENNYCYIEKELLHYNIYVVSNGTTYAIYEYLGGWNIPESGYINVNITSPKTEVNGVTVGAQNELLTGFLNVHTNYVKADVNTGYNNGYDSGYDVGYEDGSKDTFNDMYNQIQNAYDDGYYDGEEQGYKNGYDVGVSDQITLNPVSTFLEPVSAFMNINLFGGFSIGMAFSVVLFVGIALIFIKMFAGG